MDESNGVQIINNHIGPYVSAEAIDIKEGTIDGVVEGNFFDGTGNTGANSSDMWVAVKGNNYLVTDNHGINPAPSMLNQGYKITQQVPGFGCANIFSRNTGNLGAATGYVIQDSTGQRCGTDRNLIGTSNSFIGGAGTSNVKLVQD